MPYDLQEELNEKNERPEQEHFMKEHDMVFSKSQNGTITGGGFVIDSMLLKNITQYGGSPIENLEPMIGGCKNTNQTNQTNQTKNINTMAVPFGLFYKQEKMMQKSFNNSNSNSNSKHSTTTDVNDDNEISDEIYDELLKKVNANDVSSDKSIKSGKSEKKKTRKNKINSTRQSNQSNQSNHKKTAKSTRE
jgi:hypothetical protein